MANEKAGMGKDFQQKLFEAEILRRQAEEIEQQKTEFIAKMLELESSGESMKSMSGMKKGNSVLVPIGSGVYAHGELKDCSSVIAGIGSGVFMEKSISDAQKILEEQRNACESIIIEADRNVQAIADRMNRIGEEISRAQ